MTTPASEEERTAGAMCSMDTFRSQRRLELAARTPMLRERLAPYKLPSEVVCMAQLPATTTGKLLKGQLKAMAAAAGEVAR